FIHICSVPSSSPAASCRRTSEFDLNFFSLIDKRFHLAASLQDHMTGSSLQALGKNMVRAADSQCLFLFLPPQGNTVVSAFFVTISVSLVFIKIEGCVRARINMYLKRRIHTFVRIGQSLL